MTYDTKPNWGKWKHFHIVKLWQAVALWADINPDRVHYGPGAVHLAGFRGDWIVDMAPAPAAFTDRLDVAISNLLELKVEHMVSGRPAEWDITLASFAARVRSFEGFTVPPELAALAEPDKRDAEILEWPWGSRETKFLGHLAEAAKELWSRYDPTDATTAPTNGQVRDFLIKRKVATRVAQVMAQILRADELPSGNHKR